MTVAMDVSAVRVVPEMCGDAPVAAKDPGSREPSPKDIVKLSDVFLLQQLQIVEFNGPVDML